MNRIRRRLPADRTLWFLVIFAAAIAGCAPLFAPGEGRDWTVTAHNGEFVVVEAGPATSLRSLAEVYLGSASRDWVIADFNGVGRATSGRALVVPLKPTNPVAVFTDGFQTVPILVYHRFRKNGASRDKLEITASTFGGQMAYLKKHGYRVIRLSDLHAFFAGNQSLPRKAVVLTFDDGFNSAYTVAYPILKKYGFPTTIFLYTDFVGAPAALSWPQMKEMVTSGLVDIQPHSKTHANLTHRKNGETDSAYRKRILTEIRVSARAIRQRLGLPVHSFGYPYGDVNDSVIEALDEAGYRSAATVKRGGNPSFVDPYLLKRTMIYGNDDLKTFARRLAVFQRVSLK